MAAKQQYRIKALAALVNSEGGFAQLMHHGAALPDNVDKDQLQHMLDNDIVEEGEPLGGLEPIYTGDRTEVVTSTDESMLGPVEDGPTEDDDDVDGDGPIPAKSATKADWVDYAVSKGATKDEAEASTKEDLIAAYGAA